MCAHMTNLTNIHVNVHAHHIRTQTDIYISPQYTKELRLVAQQTNLQHTTAGSKTTHLVTANIAHIIAPQQQQKITRAKKKLCRVRVAQAGPSF